MLFRSVNTRETPKYSTSSDEDSSDDEIDYTSLLKGLDRAKVEKINELIDALNEKNRLLEKQEDLLYEEHDTFVSVQKSLALKVKRNEMLSSELSACHETVSSLKSINDDLNAKLEVVNKSSSYVEHVVILKGKCALGPFLSILVIECQHKCLNVNLCPWMDKV